MIPQADEHVDKTDIPRHVHSYEPQSRRLDCAFAVRRDIKVIEVTEHLTDHWVPAILDANHALNCTKRSPQGLLNSFSVQPKNTS